MAHLFTVCLPKLYNLPSEILKNLRKLKNHPMVPPLKKYTEITKKNQNRSSLHSISAMALGAFFLMQIHLPQTCVRGGWQDINYFFPQDWTNMDFHIFFEVFPH